MYDDIFELWLVKYDSAAACPSREDEDCGGEGFDHSFSHQVSHFFISRHILFDLRLTTLLVSMYVCMCLICAHSLSLAISGFFSRDARSDE